mgnify:CR=1 FL=1
MNIYLSFSPSWFVLLAVLAAIFFALFVYRKSYSKKSEVKQQLVVGIILVLFSAGIEILVVGMKLWNYTDGNWPVILWVAYFFSGLMAFQVVKFITEKVK